MVQSQTTLLTNLKALPRTVWILVIGTFINKFGSFVIPFLSIYLTRQGFSLADAGMAVGAFGVGKFTASGVGGYLADRIGRRKTIALSMFSAAILMMLLSQARSFPLILVLTALVGLAGEFYSPSSLALLADLVPADQRLTAYSVYRLAVNAGWAFGPATAGFLANHSFFWLFFGDALTSALFGFVALLALPQGIRSKKSESQWNEALKVARHDRPLLLFLASSFIINLVFYQMSSTFSLQVEAYGFSSAIYGILASLNGVIIVFCELPLTTLTQRFSPPAMIAVGNLFMGFGFMLVGFSKNISALTLCVVIWTIGEMVKAPVSSAYVANLAPEKLRGRYMGLMGFAGALGLVVGPPMGMFLFSKHPLWLWLPCGALGIISAIIIKTTPRPQTKPLQQPFPPCRNPINCYSLVPECLFKSYFRKDKWELVQKRQPILPLPKGEGRGGKGGFLWPMINILANASKIDF